MTDDSRMTSAAKALLFQIGHQLDRNVFPVVTNGGFVLPSESADSPQALGKEYHHESATRPRTQCEPRTLDAWRRPSTGSATSARGPWPAGEATSLVCGDVGSADEDALTTVVGAYPDTRAWKQEEGSWLLVESSLLPKLDRRATFLLAISEAKRAVRSWAFWWIPAIGANWIGPRHTNFPDGSICAFDPLDGTWAFGDPLVELLDLYSVWAMRHLHLEVFGRWPGPQSVAHAYERMLEVRDDEYCGCNHFDRLYAHCCEAHDRRRSVIAEAVQFGFFSNWAIRQPPLAILRFISGGGQPPKISEFL